MASLNADLSPLQRSLIKGLAGGTEFYLTGGAALSAFYLHHRQSQDLDLFVALPSAQIVPLADKPIHAGLRVDSLADLVTNKICALLGRGDIKDLIDLYYLDRSGVDVLAHLDAAKSKDGGLEPLTLSYVLRSMSTDSDRLLLVDQLAEADVAAFRDRLVGQLLNLAWPEQPPSHH